MFEKLNPAAEALIGDIVRRTQRNAWAVIIGSFAAAAAVAAYVVGNVAITTDTEKMLSEKLPWRATYQEYKKAFPYFVDTIAVVVDGATADVARDGAAKLAAALETKSLFIREVYFPRNDPFFRRHQFLYLDTDELEALTNQLSRTQAFFARLNADRTSAALFDLLNEALSNEAGHTSIGLGGAIERIAKAVDELDAGNRVPMSWQALLAGGDQSDAHREILVVRPALDYSEMLPAAGVVELIGRSAAELDLDSEHGVSVRLSGAAALSHDELKSVITGSRNAGVLALVMVLLCLLIGLRSLALIFATLASLIIGLIFTAGFAVFAVGSLNMISIAFAVLYVGLGVDFAIHICLRYREILPSEDGDNAVNAASRHVGVSLILCAVTTAIGFFAFIPTAYRGVAELGLIAGTGMFVSLVVSIVLLPALLHVLPQPRPPRSAIELPDALAAIPTRHSRLVLAVAGVVWVVAALALPGTRFDMDPIALNDPDAESVRVFRELQDDANNSPMSISVVAESRSAAKDYAAALALLPEVGSTRLIDSFIADEQEEKLLLIDDLALVLGSDLEPEPAPQFDAARTQQAISRLLATLHDFKQTETGLDAPVRALSRALAPYDATPPGPDLDDKLLASFGERIALLRDGLAPGEFDVEDLPEALRTRWITADGRARLEVYPSEILAGTREMKRFVSAVRSVVGDAATGTPIINLGAGEAVKLAFVQAFTYAFVLISALLWIILRSFKQVLLALSPLILAGLITAALSVIFSLPFNFANIIALPLLLGIGVDSALHILHRYKTALPSHGNLLQTSTARAVLFSALTTTVSFGNLASSTHAGTASMGVMLTIGVVSTLCCTLLVLPALLQQFMTKPEVIE